MKNKLNIIKILAFVIFFLFSLPGEAFTKKDSLLLKYDLSIGQEFKVAYLMTNLIQTEAMGYSVSLNQDLNTYYTTKVVRDSMETYQLSTRIDRITGAQKMMGMESAYDSQDTTEPSDPMGKELKKVMDALIGKVITMKIDSRGMVQQSDYLETIGDAGSGGMFMFDNSQTWYAVFPSKKVMPGNTWENNIKLGEGEYALNSKATYTLMSVSKKKAVIGITTVYQPMEGSKLKDITGTMTGTMEIDLNTGFPLGSETAQHMEMTLEEQGVKVPIKLDSKIIMELTR